LMSDDGQPTESLELYGLAIQTLEPINARAPGDVNVRQLLRDSHVGRAGAYGQLHMPAKATEDWGRAIELSLPHEQANIRASRAISLVQFGTIGEAVSEVAELTKSSNWSSAQWYDFACVYSIASHKIADKRQEYADRAMELLQQAVQAGWKDVDHITNDTDLDPLHDRDDFKKLLESLQSPSTSAAEAPPMENVQP